VEREVFVNVAEASDEMIFECADGAFGCVAAVYAGRSELEVDVFITEELLQWFRAFVVETLEAGM
jgi:hypothetical protein